MEKEDIPKTTVLDKEPMRRWNQHSVEMFLKNGGQIYNIDHVETGMTLESANLASGFFRGVGDHIAEARGFKGCNLKIGKGPGPRFSVRGKNDRSNNI